MSEKATLEEMKQKIRLLEARVDTYEKKEKMTGENEERYRLLIENIPSVIWITDINGKTIFISPNVKEVYGYTPEEIYEKGETLWFGRIHPDDRESVKGSFEALFTKEKRFDVEYRIQKSDGEWIWIHDRAIMPVIKDQTHYAYGVFTDITRRKRYFQMEAAQYRLIDYAAGHSIIELLQKFLDETEDLTNSKIGFYHFIDPTQKIVALQAWSTNTLKNGCEAGEFNKHYPIEKAGVWVDCIREGKPVIHNNYDALHHKKGLPEGHVEVTRTLIVPVIRAGQITAILGVGNKETDYASRDVELVQKFADLAWETVERKRTEEAKRSSEENYREIFNATSEAILIHDGMTGEILDANNSVYDLFGYSPEEVKGITVGDLSSKKPAYTQEKALERIRKAVEEAPQTFDWQSKKKDGSVFWSSVSLKSTRIGGKGRVLAVIRDISERKRAEKAIQENEFRLNAIFNHRFQLTALLDPNGKVLMVNQTACNMVGRTSADLVGEDFWELPHWSNSQNLRDQVRDGIRQARKGYDISFETIHPGVNGELHYIDFSMAPIRDENGNVIFIVPEGHDITEKKKNDKKRKSLENQLQQAQKMEAIGTLAGGIAHDFNNILSSIIGYTEIALYDKLSEDSEARYSLEQVLKAGNRAKQLVKQILMFSRQKGMEKIPLSPDTLIKESIKLLRATIPATIEIRESTPPGLGTIQADATQIHQVLMNVCANSAYAMRKRGGILDIRLSRIDTGELDAIPYLKADSAAYIQLVVSDTGKGMDQRTLGRIFDPFFTTKPKEDGTGLGMSVVHGILEDHGGAIHVQSKKGKGTTVRIIFPVVDTLKADESQETSQSPGGNERIIVIDDDINVVDMLGRMLSQLGYSVTPETRCEKVLDLFGQDPYRYDLVITDQTMPAMTGDRLAKRLIGMRKDIPIILCTGFSDTIDREEARRIGIREFVMKPFTRAIMSRVIRAVLDNPLHQ